MLPLPYIHVFMDIFHPGLHKIPTTIWPTGRSRRKRNHKLMCGSCLKTPIPVSTRKLPLSMASPTWGACSNVWRRWRSLSPSTARVSRVTPGRTGDTHHELVKYTRPFFPPPCSFLEEARVLLLSGEGQKDRPALRGGRPQRASQMAEEWPGDQAFGQVRASSFFSSLHLFNVPGKSRRPTTQKRGRRSTAHKNLPLRGQVASAP